MKHLFELTQPSELASVLDALTSAVSEGTESKDLAGEMRLIAEEALTNVLKYAYRESEPRGARVVLSVDTKEVGLEIRDQGRPFDPLAQPPPELDAPIEEREEGGLGIHLIKSLADSAAYAREGETNVLRITKRRL